MRLDGRPVRRPGGAPQQLSVLVILGLRARMRTAHNTQHHLNATGVGFTYNHQAQCACCAVLGPLCTLQRGRGARTSVEMRTNPRSKHGTRGPQPQGHHYHHKDQASYTQRSPRRDEAAMTRARDPTGPLSLSFYAHMAPIQRPRKNKRLWGFRTSG